MITCIISDLRANADNPKATKALIKAAFFSRGFHTLLIHRIATSCLFIPFIGYIFARILWLINSVLHSNDISIHAKMGHGTRMPHPLGIIIGDGVIIGSGVTIMQHVTLGARDARNRQNTYCLCVEDGVFIGVSVSVLGTLTIGNNTTIGAHSLVLASLPPNSTAYGVPATLMR